MQQHPGHHRYGPQGGQQGPPGTHRPVPGRAGRGPDQYYDQQGNLLFLGSSVDLFFFVSIIIFVVQELKEVED